ncbi:MAG: Rho termination factor N-terminal domain-containing protein, partial [Methanomicrobiales archaeon]|nr:Rho termination factor N-terminal domain-containing protein [Methanomicrobiales archaeon]
MAKDMGISGYSNLKKQELIVSLLQTQAEKDGNIFAGGMLEITNDGYGFLRGGNLLQGPGDVYVSSSQIRRFGLRTGDSVMGQARPPKEGERYQSLLRVELVNDLEPELSKGRPHFDTLTPIFPNKIFNIETVPENVACRLINLVAPIGRGQRGLIVSPPKAGKTI